MSRIWLKPQTILSAKSATGIGNVINVSDCRHLCLILSTLGMGSGDTITVKIQGSLAASAPTFSSAKSSINEWDYINVVDLEDQSTIDGDTGITFSDADDVRNFEININGLRFVNVEVTVISDAVNTSINAKLVAFQS